MRAYLPALPIVAVTLLGGSCGHGNPTGPSPLTSTDSLVAALQQQSATVVRGDLLPRPLPCLSASGQVLFVNTGVVNVFEYPTVAAAESGAAKISPDGTGVVGNGCAALITWVDAPHFYKSDRLLVVYAGSSDDVLRPLEAVLGKPFASR